MRLVDARASQCAYPWGVSTVQTIVVAYDDPDSRTLARAADLAEDLRAALIVTNVVSADRESAESGTEYGHERLDRFLSEHRELSPNKLAKAVVDGARAFSGGGLADDSAVVVVKRVE